MVSRQRNDDDDKKKSGGSSSASSSSSSNSQPTAQQANSYAISLHVNTAMNGAPSGTAIGTTAKTTPVWTSPSSSRWGNGWKLNFGSSGSSGSGSSYSGGSSGSQYGGSGNYQTRGSSAYNQSRSAEPQNATQALSMSTAERFGINGLNGIGNGRPDIRGDKWFVGDTPTSMEIAARILAFDPNNQDAINEMWRKRFTQGDETYSAYAAPTSQAVYKLQSLGVQFPEGGVTREWCEQALSAAAQSGLLNLSSTSGNATSKKRASKDETITYWIAKLYDDLDRTEKAEREWAAFKEDVMHKAGDTSRNWSNEQIYDSLDWSKYPTLRKAIEDGRSQQPSEFVRALDFDMGYFDGLCWAGRNGGGSGDAFTDTVNYILGEGNQYQYDPDKAARFDASNLETFDPYSAGSTMYNAGLYYNKYNFEDGDIDAIRGDLNSSDNTKSSTAASVIRAGEYTKTVDAQIEELIKRVDEDVASGMVSLYGLEEGVDSVDAYIDAIVKNDSTFKDINDLNDSLLYGFESLKPTTHAIDPRYKYSNLKTYIQEQLALKEQMGTPSDKRGKTEGLLNGIWNGIKAVFTPMEAAPENPYENMGTPSERPAEQYLNGMPGRPDSIPTTTPETTKIGAQFDDAGRLLVRDPQSGEMVPVGTIPVAAVTQNPVTASATVSDVYGPNPYNVPPKTEAEEKATEEAEKNRSAASGVVRDVAAPAVKDAFHYQYSDFERDRMLLVNAYKSGSLDVKQAYTNQVYSANHYASENYPEAHRLMSRYDNARRTQERAIQAQADLLKEDPTASNIPEQGTKLTQEEITQLTDEQDSLCKTLEPMYRDYGSGPELVDEEYRPQAEAAKARLDEIDGILKADANAPQLTENQQRYKELSDIILAQTNIMNDEQVQADYRAGEEILDECDFNWEQVDVLAKEAGYPAGGGDYCRSLLWAVHDLTTNYSPDFDAYSAFDSALRSGNYTYEQLIPYLQKVKSESKENLDAIATIRSEAEKYDIHFDEDQEAVLSDLETQLARNEREADYDLMRSSPDFKQKANDMRQQLLADIKNGKAADGMDMLMYAAVDEHLRNPEHDPDFNNDFNTGKGIGIGPLRVANNDFNYDAMAVMTDDEVDTLLYIRGTLGAEAAQNYYDFLNDQSYGRLNTRLYENMTGATEEFLEQQNIRESFGKSTLATVGTVAADPLKIGGTLYTIRQLVTGGKINTQHYMYGMGDALAATREEARGFYTDNFGENGGKAYDAVTSALQSWYYSMIGAGLGLNALAQGEGVAAKAVNAAAGSALQVLPSSYDTARSVIERGGTNAQAGTLMLVDGIAECLTEAIEVSDVWGSMEAGRTGAKRAIIDGLIGKLQVDDVAGEAISQLISDASDDVIMQEKSNREARITELIGQGVQHDQAVAQADKEFWNAVVDAGVAGGFSAFISSASGYATGKILRSRDGRERVNYLTNLYVEQRHYDYAEARKIAEVKAAMELQQGLDKQAYMDMGYSEQDATKKAKDNAKKEFEAQEKEIHRNYVATMDAQLAAKEQKWNQGLQERQGPVMPTQEAQTEEAKAEAEAPVTETTEEVQQPAAEAPADLGTEEAREEQRQLNNENAEQTEQTAETAEAEPEVQGPQAPEQQERPALETIPTMEESRRAMAEAAAAAQQNRQPLSDEERGELGRQVTALGEAERGGDVKNQTVTIASVFESFNVNQGQGFPGMATAAAQKLVSRLGGSKAVRVLRSAMTQAVRDGLSLSDVQQAVQIAAITGDTTFDGLTRNWMSREQFAAAVEQMKAKISDADVLDTIRKTIKDSRIGQAYTGLVERGALKGAVAAEEKATKAKAAYSEAKKANDTAKAKVEAAQQNLNNAIAAQDEEVTGDTESAVRDAATDVEHAVNDQVNYQRGEDKAKAEAEQAQKDAQQTKREEDLKTMQEAQARVESQEQTEQAQREEAEAQRQQAEQAAAEASQDQTDHENDVTISFEEFMAQNYPNASAYERSVIKAAFEARANEARDPDKAKRRERIVKGLGRLFGINIEIVDTSQNKGMPRYEGLYDRDSNTITIDRGISQSDVIYRVALHELMHAAEHSGMGTQLSRTILRLAYSKDGTFNREQMERDIDAVQKLYNDRLRRNKKDHPGISRDQATSEVVANKVMEVLYGNDPDVIDQLVRDDVGLGRRILDSISNIVSKLTGFKDNAVNQLESTRQLFENAVRRSDKNYKKYVASGEILPDLTPNYSLAVTPDMDAQYMEAVRNGDMGTAQQLVDQAAKAAGYNIPHVYHGTPAQFNQFSYEFLGSNGQDYGNGFYFTNDPSLAETYTADGGTVLEGTLKIENPLSETEVTFTRKEIEGIIRKLDPTGDDILSNYESDGTGYPSKAWYNRALKTTVDSILSGNSNDVDIVGELTNIASAEDVLPAVRATGRDGIIHDGSADGYPNVYVVFESDQFKRTDPVTRDDNGNVIPLSQRFNPENKDIRYSLPSNDILDQQIQDFLATRLGDYGLPPVAQQNEEDENGDVVQARYGGSSNRDVGTGTETNPKHSPMQITKNLIGALGIGDYVGTRKMNNMPKAVAGYYEKRAKYIAVRANEANSFITNMHEIGHAIADKVKMTGTQDMVDKLDDVFKQNYKAADLPDEAFAEFMWRYMANERQGRLFAGDAFVNDFEAKLEESGLAEAVRKASADLNAFLNSDMKGKYEATVKSRHETRKKGTFHEFFRKLGMTIDRSAGAEDVMSAIRKANKGKKVAFSEDIRANSLMQNFTGKKAHDLLENTLTDADGNRIDDGLGKKLWRAGIQNDEQLERLNEYMLLKHSLARDEQHKPVFDVEDFPEAQRRARIAELEQQYPQLKDAAKAFQDWRKAFLQAWLVDTGFSSQEAFDRWNEMYPDYVPTKRIIDKVGGFNLYAAKGSTLDILNPLETWCEYVNSIVGMVRQNQTALAWHNAYNKYDGLGIFGRRVTPDLQKVFTGKESVWKDISDALQEGAANGGINQDTLDNVIAAINKGLTSFMPVGYNAEDGVTVVLSDGSKVYYQIADKNLYKLLAIQGGKSSELVNGLSKTVGRVNKAMSALTTGSNPIFAVRNFLRDYQSSVNYGSWASTYLTGLPKWLNAAYQVWTKSGKYQEYMSLGGGGWTRIDTNSAEGSNELRNVLSGERDAEGNLKNNKTLGEKIWATITLEKLNEVVEQASRFAEYAYGQNDTSTVEGRNRAFLASQDVTVDFARQGDGDVMRGLKQIIPFFGASVQGIYRTGRMLTEGERDMAKSRFLKTFFNTALTSALAAAAMLKFASDDEKEAFENMSDDLKAGHFYLPNVAPEIFGEQPLIRIPLAQDPFTHAVHAMVTNAAWKGTTDQDIIDILGVANGILDNVVPSTRPVWAPITDVLSNKNWYGSKIIPTRLEDLPPTAQYTYDTPELFVIGGRALGMSPLNLQYLAEQYTGFLGQLAIPALSKDKYTGEMGGLNAAIAAAQRRLTTDPFASTEVTSTFYDNFNAISGVVSTVKQGQPLDQLKRGLSNGDARRAYDEAYKMTHKGGILYTTKQSITDAFAKIDKINRNTTLSEEDKQDMILNVRMKMMRECLRANAAVEQYREKYITGENVAVNALLKRVVSGVRMNAPNQ